MRKPQKRAPKQRALLYSLNAQIVIKLFLRDFDGFLTAGKGYSSPRLLLLLLFLLLMFLVFTIVTIARSTAAKAKSRKLQKNVCLSLAKLLRIQPWSSNIASTSIVTTNSSWNCIVTHSCCILLCVAWRYCNRYDCCCYRCCCHSHCLHFVALLW